MNPRRSRYFALLTVFAVVSYSILLSNTNQYLSFYETADVGSLLSVNISTSSNNVTHTSISNMEDTTKQWQWLDMSGVELYESFGDATTCRDVIYTADNRLPTDESSIVNASWGALSFIVERFPTFHSTCAAYFHISDNKTFWGGTLNSVWGRLPATALAMSSFPNARIFLYMDTDAMLANAKYDPTEMYDTLVKEHYQHRQDHLENNVTSSSKPSPPSLIVNKPTGGWLCKAQCETFGLGHGCFNSGVLLWRRSKGAELILRAWWESRLDNTTQNFHNHDNTEEFFGWSGEFPSIEKMSEQNRLMYVYHKDPDVQRWVLPVPRQVGTESNTTSCPETVDEAHTPCLQQDDVRFNAYWNRSMVSCYINHFANTKDTMHNVFKTILQSAEKNKIRERLYPLIQQTHPDDLAGDITEILLGMDNSKLLQVLDSPEELSAKIQQSINVLEVRRNMTARLYQMSKIAGNAAVVSDASGSLEHVLPRHQGSASTDTASLEHRLSPLQKHKRDIPHNHSTHNKISDGGNKSDPAHNHNGGKTASLLPRCPVPRNSPKWDHHSALVDENFDTAERVRRITAQYSTNHSKEEDQLAAAKIPHRLIFTHKNNLFNCSNSASNSTPPELYTFAENAKATVNVYRRIWPDLEFVFLTNNDCIDALNRTQPSLITFFKSLTLEGMYKADLCRAAYLYLHGGYYFDVDLLVVRPYVAPKNASFVTVKGDGFPKDGFFQAFLAAEKGNSIVRRSIEIMLEALRGQRTKGKYLGPTSLMEAWMEVEKVTDALNVINDNNGVYLLTEFNLNGPGVAMYKNLSNVIASKNGFDLYQRVPQGHGNSCQFSSGACSVIVLDESYETLYFYSRVLGTKWCGKQVRENCTMESVLLERLH